MPLGQGYLLGRPAEAMTGIDPLLKTRTRDLCESRETVAPFIEAGQTASADSDDAVLRTIFDANPEVAAIALLDASEARSTSRPGAVSEMSLGTTQCASIVPPIDEKCCDVP